LCPISGRGKSVAEVRIAFVGAIIEEPEKAQREFNSVVSSYKPIVKCRSGMPFPDEGIAVVSIVVMGDVDTINAFTGRLGQIKNVQVKSAVSKKILRATN
jgi:putative iron-only hydrogenase system regulator